MKNFDRIIEQRMNEQQVPPPFGAWNRIAAELDAMPIAAAEPAPVNNLIPKRAIASFIAGMLIMGSAIATGFWVNSTINRDNKIVGTNEAAKPASFSVAVGNGLNDLPLLQLSATSPIAKLPQYVAFARPVSAKKANATLVPVSNPANLLNGHADVPAPIQAVTLAPSDLKETYYFPPVDIVTIEKCKTEVEEPKVARVENAKANTDDDRPKADQKKFRPPHRRKAGWPWGSINRL